MLRDVAPLEDCHKDSLSTKTLRNRYITLHRYTVSDLRHVATARSQGLVSQALHAGNLIERRKLDGSQLEAPTDWSAMKLVAECL